VVEDKIHQGAFKLLCGLVTLSGIAAQCFEDDAVERFWHIRVKARRLDDEVFLEGLECVNVAVVFKQARAGEGFPEDDAEGKNIRTSVDGLAASLLRSHIGELTLKDARRSELGVCFGDTEVCEFNVSVEGEEDVVGAHIPMDDVEVMRIV